jgi:hypothetical protein
MIVFTIVKFAFGALAILDAILMFFPITIVQGHDRNSTPEPWKTLLRVLEAAIGAALVVWGILDLVHR